MTPQRLYNKTTAKEFLTDINCIDLIRRLGIKQKNNLIHCLNPNHTDKNPSMHVYASNAFCFSCKKNMNAIDIVMQVCDLTYTQTVSYLKQMY